MSHLIILMGQIVRSKLGRGFLKICPFNKLAGQAGSSRLVLNLNSRDSIKFKFRTNSLEKELGMHSLILWIDTQEALILQMTPNNILRNKIQSKGHHLKESLGVNHTVEQSDEGHFYHQVCEYLSKIDSDEWLIVGPGMARHHLLNHIQKHHPQLEKKIIGSETLGRVSDGQLIDFSGRFFKHAHLFQSLS